jgi:hypothetical protein
MANKNRFTGKLATDVYRTALDESKIARLSLTAAQAVAADADGLLAAEALPTAAADYTSFENSIPYPRNITAVCSNTQTGNMVVTGTNIKDEVITETITLTSDTPAVGAKAFKTVTNINLPAKVGSETINVGWGDILGLPYIFTVRPLLFATVAGVIETTAPTVVVDADEIEKNTIDLNSALAGSEIDIYLIL